MIENDVRVFILSPHYIVCNQTDIPVTVWAFCILQKQKQDLNMPKDSDHIGTYEIPKQKTNER